MRHRIARSRAVLAAALVTLSMLGGVITATTSDASSSSFPWSDPNAAGSLIFYNSSGQVITGGSFSGANDTIAAYVEGTYNPQNTDTKATLYAYTPVINVAPGAWNGEALGGATRYPVSGASVPADISSLTLPVETGNAVSDESLGAYEADFPNNDTSTTDGYADLYVLRLVTSGPAPAGADATYDDAVIEVTNTGEDQGTWTVVSSDPWTTSASTTVALGLSSPGPVTVGTSETLTATVSPSATGIVQFFSGTTSLGTAPVTNGVATLITSAEPLGSDSLTASFTATGGSSPTATSNTVTLVVNAISTTVVLGVSNPGPISFGASETLTATVSPSATGTVQFFSGTTSLGTAPVTNGVATLVTTAVPVGNDALTAAFTATGGSSPSAGSSAVSLVVNAASTVKTTRTTLKIGSKKIVKGTADRLTAIVAPAASGKVTFFQGSKKIASQEVVKGSASVTTKALSVGTDSIKAVFTSSNASKYSNSTSAVVKVVVKK